MIELPDDELDKLFRKSSEELDPQFDPEDWNKLKKRLDSEDGRIPFGWLRKWWPIGLLALLVPVGIYYAWNNQESRSEKVDRVDVVGRSGEREEGGGKGRKSEEEKAVGKGDESLVDGEKSEGKLKEQVNSSIEKDQEKRENIITNDLALNSSRRKNIRRADKESIKILPRGRSNTGGVYLEPNRSKREGGDGAFSENQRLPVNTENPGSDRKNADEGQFFSPKSSAASSIDERERLSVSAKLLQRKPVSWHNITPLPGIVAQEPAPVPVVENARQKMPTAKWAVRFGYSPDLSSVGLKNFSKPGSAISFMAEYAVIPRLFVQSGIVRSVKDYNARAGEYTWPSKWPQTVLPSSVDGICRILEIPLNLRYDISQTDRSRWFAGGGMSSYYMQNEKYKYNYDKYVHDPKYKWEGKTGWYWLSHINASAGYEYRFSQKLSLLAEPYVRVPIKKVGYGKVNLFTTGVWISVRYTPVFK
ncbi:hypothetical protein [Dyadobacter bucti]|uniref:hypothetical protein n=1 Tax=Dyadobacter bucti TaxID=2572203 RepID=UPI003F723128